MKVPSTPFSRPRGQVLVIGSFGGKAPWHRATKSGFLPPFPGLSCQSHAGFTGRPLKSSPATSHVKSKGLQCGERVPASGGVPPETTVTYTHAGPTPLH